MKKECKPLLLVLLILVSGACAFRAQREIVADIRVNAAQEDLVLLHGLTNKHPWSAAFLETVLSIWGEGNVFVVYTNSSERIYTKTFTEKEIVYCGEDNTEAGDASIEDQVGLLRKKIELLQSSKGLAKRFHIIAHSMGGLVARRYIYDHPYTVKGLVTLGTPHHGSPLADSFGWASFFIGAEEAVEDLHPSNVEKFNERFPVRKAPLANHGKMYTIRGDCDGDDCFGWGGELIFGWVFITQTTGKDNDGLVPHDSATIDGAVHVRDFPDYDHYDHYDLVREPEVAETASLLLLKK